MTEPCFIIGGGSSLRGFDWSLLDGKFVVAVNRAYEVLPNANIVYFTDNIFWRDHKSGLLNHKGRLMKGMGGSLVNPSIKEPRVEEFKITGVTGLEMAPGCTRSGKNSVYAVMNICAVHLGFKAIYLLGVDMGWGKAQDRATSHFHDGYKNMSSNYLQMKEAFETIKQPLEELGVRVVNLNPHSKLEVFEKRSWEQEFGEPTVLI